MQEVITLLVFVPFAVIYMNQPLKWYELAGVLAQKETTGIK